MPSIKEILAAHTEDPQKLIDILCVDTNDERDPEAFRDEYEGERTRRTKSVGMRASKTIELTDDNGKKTGETKTIYPAKLVYPYPKKIVRTAGHFVFGGEMTISANDSNDALNEFIRVWEKDLKMQTNLKRMARACMIETKAALLFYPQPIKDEASVDNKTKYLKLRCMVLDNESGAFYPHFDDYGDMDAFIRRYKVLTIEGKSVEKAQIYTKDMILTYVNQSGWNHEKGEKNLFGKIPVVYVEQTLPEWEDVATLIDDFEVRVSRLADTNDYFAEPLLKLYGNISKAPGKDEVGKMIQFEMKQDLDGKISHGDAEYATWDRTPESIKLELDEVKEGIFSMTSTPDLSFDNVKGMSITSGKALQFMFMDALMKREEKGEIFYDALNRAISVVAAGIAGYTNVKLGAGIIPDEIEITFSAQLPDDLVEKIDSLVAATGGKPILSQETAASISPFTKDASEEIERLKAESAATPVEPESFNM